MKAIVLSKYGSPDVLELQEVDKPIPKENEVLIKVHAASVNDWDWGLLRGEPLMLRPIYGLFKPKYEILGVDVSGEVKAVGENVTKFKPGDNVYGDLSESGFGGFAEFVCSPEGALTLKPGSMTFEQAASIPHAMALALQGLVDIGKIKEGQKVLINGAGGGVGTFGVQIAKLYGVEITGVDSAEKLDVMRSVGFDHVIDYKAEDFTKNGQGYDLILDVKTNRSPFDYARALKPKGTYVTVGGTMGRLLQALILAPSISLFSKKNIRVLGLKPNKDMAYVNELFEQGKIQCVIDGPYKLSEVPKAIQYFGAGKHTGKVVISVEYDNEA